MTALHPCPRCARHVRATESQCPFCASAVSFEATTSFVPGRLGRAAIFAFRTTAAAAALTACGPTAEVPPSTSTIVQPYGAPPEPPRPPPTTTVPPPESTIVQPYGAPPEPEPPPPPPPTTAVRPPHSTIVQPYGAPPHPHEEPGGPAAAYGGAPGGSGLDGL